jgi:hypothetical protein
LRERQRTARKSGRTRIRTELDLHCVVEVFPSGDGGDGLGEGRVEGQGLMLGLKSGELADKVFDLSDVFVVSTLGARKAKEGRDTRT